MDSERFEAAVRCAREIYDGLERAEGTAPEVLARGYREGRPEDRPMHLAAMIEGSVEVPMIWDALCLVAEQDGGRLPSHLAAWLAEARAGKRPRPTRRGPDRNANLVRDWMIVGAVEVLVDDGMRATRNSAISPRACPEGGSACDAVGVALGMNYKAVERVWTTSGRGNRSFTTRAAFADLSGN